MSWTTFRSTLNVQFRILSENRTIEESSEIIIDNYITAALTSKTIYGNSPISIPKKQLVDALVKDFEECFNSADSGSQLFFIPNNLSKTLPLVWSNVQMNNIVLVPGSVSPITNVILSGGTSAPTPLTFSGSKLNDFITNLIAYFSSHLSTISGLNTSNIPAESGVRPNPFPWSGLTIT